MDALLPTIASLFKPDERFIMHRYYSTRIATIVGLVLMVAWFNYELIAKDIFRWDLAIIVGVMAITKVAAMLYYRISH
jgi:hypothetical protein